MWNGGCIQNVENSFEKWQGMEGIIGPLTDQVRNLLFERYQVNVPVNCTGFLIRCLRVKDYNVEKAAKLVKNVIKSTKSLENMIDKFRPKFYETLYFNGTFTLLRSRDEENRQVLLSRISNCDLKEFDFDELAAAQILVFSLAVANSPETQRNGVVFIFDLSECGMKHLRILKPTRLLQLVEMMLESTPAKIKAIHHIFHPRLFGLVYQMVRPLLSEKLVQRIHFHGDDVSSLHKYISADILPVSLGGRKSEVEAVDTDFLTYLIKQDSIHKELMNYGIPSI